MGPVITSKHTLAYCGHCERDMVLCATCGNGTCNGTYGCDDCPEAYAHSAAHAQDPSNVTFAKDIRADAVR